MTVTVKGILLPRNQVMEKIYLLTALKTVKLFPWKNKFRNLKLELNERKCLSFLIRIATQMT